MKNSLQGKNIIFITNLHLWSLDNGKGGRAFYHTIQGYIEQNWNVILITTGGGVPDNIKEQITLIEKDLSSFDEKINSSSKPLSVYFRFSKLNRQREFYIREASKILQSNPEKKFVVYAYEVEAVSAAKLISVRFGFPLVTRFQGTILAKLENSFLNRLRRTPHFQALATQADLIIMTNDGTQGLHTIRRLNNNSRVCFWRNGVDQLVVDNSEVDELRNQLGLKNEFTFVTVSRLVDWKRVDLAIKGFAKVLENHPICKLIIIGDGVELKNLQNITSSLGISEKVIFLGAIEQHKIGGYLKLANVFLSFYDLSNLGNPIMEAMIAGKPIVTIDVGDTKELIVNNQNGLLIPNDSLHLIPSKMMTLIENSDLASALATGALETARKEFWTWQARISEEITHVSKLIDRD